MSPLTATSPGSKSASPKVRARPKAAFVLARENVEVIYGPVEREKLSTLVDLVAPPMGEAEFLASPDSLRNVEVIFSGWGAPLMDRAFLAAAPKLKAIFYGAGSTRYFLTPEFWDRGIVLSSVYAANAVPVAEYTLGTILLSLKHFWRFAAETKQGGPWDDHRRIVPGAFRSTVGLVSCGMIGRRVLELLRNFDCQKLVYCPYLSETEARELGAERSSLENLFRRSDVVSLHTPLLPETKGMIDGRLLPLMKPGATLINTARGGIVNHDALFEILSARPDLTAVLDVTEPEPPPPDYPLFRLPNVVITPHIAGSLGPECHRLGFHAVEEFQRYMAGEPLKWPITRENAARLA